MTTTPSHWPYPGARWWKFDFHTHTPASSDYGKGPDQTAQRHISPEDWLLAFMRAEVDCVAVTDHNRLTKPLEFLREPPLLTIPSLEYSARRGEILGPGFLHKL